MCVHNTLYIALPCPCIVVMWPWGRTVALGSGANPTHPQLLWLLIAHLHLSMYVCMYVLVLRTHTTHCKRSSSRHLICYLNLHYLWQRGRTNGCHLFYVVSSHCCFVLLVVILYVRTYECYYCWFLVIKSTLILFITATNIYSLNPTVNNEKIIRLTVSGIIRCLYKLIWAPCLKQTNVIKMVAVPSVSALKKYISK